jgi:hypothetical protein
MTNRPIILCATSPHELPVDKKTGARLWKEFLRVGSNHSSHASFLPYIIRRCERECVPYRLTAYPGNGYFIERIEGMTPSTRGKL